MNRHRISRWGAAAVAFSAAGMGWAQEAAQPVAEAVAANGGMTLRQMIEYGEWVMYVLPGVSVLGLALVLYFMIMLQRRLVAPPQLQRDLAERIRQGDLEEARRLCEYRPCPLASVALAGLNYRRTVESPDPVLVKDILEGEGRRQAELILGPTQYLLDIAAIAPMLGLLGTVFGMIRAFNAVALDIAKARPIVLASGVSQALITTAYGLMIGIPAMMLYAYFRRRAMRVLSDLETASVEILTSMQGARRS